MAVALRSPASLLSLSTLAVERAKREQFITALRSRNLDTIIEIFSTLNDRVKDNRIIELEAAIHNRCDVIKFLVQKGRDVDLNWLLRHTINYCENNLETVEGLCLLGAEGIADYWDACIIRLCSQVAIYRIFLEHNVVSPGMLLCERGDLDENEIPRRLRRRQWRRQLLILWLDISKDRCRGRWGERFPFRMVRDHEYGDVLGLVELYARNGAPIAIRSSLLEQPPNAESRVAAIMGAALQPASLRSLCRKTVREVGPKSKFKSWVQELGLPKKLFNYLCSSHA